MEVFRPELCAFPLRAYVDATRDALGAEALEAMLRPYGIGARDLEDPTAWYSLEFVEAFLAEVVERCGLDHLDAATRLGMTPKYLGPLFPLVVAFGSPLFTFQQEDKAAARFNRTGVWSMEEGRPGFVRMRYRPLPHILPEKTNYICRIRGIQEGMIPSLFGRPEGTVTHPRCTLRGDEYCVYEVTWSEPPQRRDAAVGLLIGGAIGGLVAASIAMAPWYATLVVSGLSALGWTLGRIRVLRSELRERVREITDHNHALARMQRANEQRFEEIVQAKAEVEQRVELRTRELRETTHRLSETLNEIQALDRAKTDFFNNVSHELRSPLTLILAPLDDLAAGRTPPGGEAAAFAAMRRNAARLLHLINQLLDLAKIDAGQMEIVPTPTDLLGLVKSVLTGFEAAAQQRSIGLELTAPATMTPVALDASWIESAINNLVANALRFTPANGKVRVGVGDRGDEVYITVSDDGPGIAPADQSKVFARFAQGDSSRRVVGGTGIGLALVREAARLHGGDVRLISDFGKGSTFTLTIPRRPERSATNSTSSAPAARIVAAAHDLVEDFQESGALSERPGPNPHAPLALVVEDNVELREFIADVLAVRYRVHTAADGRQGLERALDLGPDVVVSDVAMPEMDGYQLCRELRAHEKTVSTPIVLVTARTEVASILEGFDAGTNDYVLKPFHGRELLARVDVHVRLRRMVHELALRERHAALGVLAASVAHQVRNPLTTLISGLPAMKNRIQSTVDQRTNDLMDVMIDCATRIERVTLDLMDLSRVDREEGGDYRPSEGLRSAVRMLRARAAPSIVIDEQIEDSVVIHGRVGDMNHVFLNLLDNAIRAAGDGGRVRIEARSAGDAYLVRVHDSGPGVSPEMAERIFEPFFTTRQAGEGTGLGLAIARQVIQQAGGQIHVERSDLGGAAFVVRIPTGKRAPLPAQARPN